MKCLIWVAALAALPSSAVAQSSKYHDAFYYSGFFLRASLVCGEKHYVDDSFRFISSPELKQFAAAYPETTKAWMADGAGTFNAGVMRSDIKTACVYAAKLRRNQIITGQADDYRLAETRFNRLPIDQRYELQVLLGVAGYWPAVANDQFSHRLFEAIGRFQEANGFPASGILTSAQIDRIRQIADPILAYWQFRMVRHPTIGLPLWVPFGVGFNQSPTRSGIDFENSNKIASISFNFFPNGNLRSTYSRLFNVPGLRPVYNKLKDNFFAIQMEGGGFNAYSRYQVVRSGIIGFTLSWTQDDAQNAVLHGERLATLMSDLFRANIELGLPRSPPTPRPATTVAVPQPQLPSPPAIPAPPEGKKPDNQKSFGTGFFVSSDGHIITNSHVVENCGAVQVTFEEASSVPVVG